MSEANERDLEKIIPEAAENPQAEEPAAGEAAAAAPEADAGRASGEPAAQEAPAPEEEDAEDAEDAEVERPKPAKKRASRKRRRRNNVILALVLVLAVALLIFCVLVGYGLGVVRGARRAEEQQAGQEQAADFDAPSGYDPFAEELTNENQQALDALAGVGASANSDALALMGEDSFFGAAPEETQAAAEPVVVAEFGDGQQLMSDEVQERYNERLTNAIFSGYSKEEVAGTLLDEVLRDMVGERVKAQHAEEMGLYELTDEDRAEIAEEAERVYEESVDANRALVDTEGKSEEEARAAVESYLRDNLGVDRASIEAGLEERWWERKLRDALTDSVTIGEADVQAAYDERLAAQKASFTEFPDDYEFSQRNGEIILYNLPGYRAVKVLLLGFDDPEAAMAVYAQAGAEGGDDLDAYYAGPEARAEQALKELRAGADMDEMILTIGRDEGMNDERQRAEGYYVSANSSFWPPEFVSATLALERPGDYSEPVRTNEGVCILQYLGEVPEGDVPLEDVRGVLTAQVLEAAREDAYNAQVQAWVDEAQPSYYPERMQ